MFYKPAASLLTLPVEILHRIFNELDGTSLFLSVRDVCQQLRFTVDNYHHLTLDLTCLSKPDFHRLFTFIRPECVTGLSLSDGGTTPGQIGVFLSLVDIRHFTRLRSLTLLNIGWQHLCLFLDDIKTFSLTSLVVHSTSYHPLGVDQRDEEEIVQHLSSILSQPSLRCLELLIDDLSALLEKLQWPDQFKLRQLRMTSCREKLVSMMITRSPDLETLTLGNESDLFSTYCSQPEEWFPTACPRLTSLTLRSFPLQMDKLQSALSQTPSLRHLKIISSTLEVIDASRWEQFIQTKLLALSRLEFYTSLIQRETKENKDNCVLKEMIHPFCT